MFIDTHAHLDFHDYDPDREEVIRRSREDGIDYIINVGTSIEGSKRSLELARTYDFIYASISIHPHHAQEIDKEILKELEELASSPKVAAIGETGLDFYKNLSPRKNQEELFRFLIKLARKLKLPIIIHSREAPEDTLRILREEKGELQGVLHCYSYPWPVAEQILDMGFHISVAGQVTFPKSQNLRDIVKKIPLEKMLLETDSPFLAPQKFRGKRNEPGYIRYIAQELSQIYGLSIDHLARISSENAKKLFNLKWNFF